MTVVSFSQTHEVGRVCRLDTTGKRDVSVPNGTEQDGMRFHHLIQNIISSFLNYLFLEFLNNFFILFYVSEKEGEMRGK